MTIKLIKLMGILAIIVLASSPTLAAGTLGTNHAAKATYTNPHPSKSPMTE